MNPGFGEIPSVEQIRWDGVVKHEKRWKKFRTKQYGLAYGPYQYQPDTDLSGISSRSEYSGSDCKSGDACVHWRVWSGHNKCAH